MLQSNAIHFTDTHIRIHMLVQKTVIWKNTNKLRIMNTTKKGMSLKNGGHELGSS